MLRAMRCAQQEKMEMAKDHGASDPPGGVVEQAMEQARRAADTYCDFVKQAIAATPSGGNEFAERIKGYAEKQLSQARNFQDYGSHPSRFHAVAYEGVWRTKFRESIQTGRRYGEEDKVGDVVTRLPNANRLNLKKSPLRVQKPHVSVAGRWMQIISLVNGATRSLELTKRLISRKNTCVFN